MILQLIFSVLLSFVIFFIAFNAKTGQTVLACNMKALLVVLGGTFAATLIAYPWRKLTWTFQLLKKAFLTKDEIDWTITNIVDLARTYRHDGIRALEQQANRLSTGFLKDSIHLVSFQCSREKIEQIVQKEAQLTYVGYETGYRILYNMARLAPALGLVGTIVTLVRVFGQITDPKSLAGNMAIALMSTFYGVVLANLCFVPLSNKLREFIDREEIRLELIREGILDLYDGENPRLMRFKLETLSSSVAQHEKAQRRPRLRLGMIAPKRGTSSVTP